MPFFQTCYTTVNSFAVLADGPEPHSTELPCYYGDRLNNAVAPQFASERSPLMDVPVCLGSLFALEPLLLCVYIYVDVNVRDGYKTSHSAATRARLASFSPCFFFNVYSNGILLSLTQGSEKLISCVLIVFLDIAVWSSFIAVFGDECKWADPSLWAVHCP